MSSRSVPAPGAAGTPRVAPRIAVPVVRATPKPAPAAQPSPAPAPVEPPAPAAAAKASEKSTEKSTGKDATPARRPRTNRARSTTPRTSGTRRSSTSRAVPESRLVYLSVTEAVRRSGASASSVRAWVRTGQVRTRSGAGPRGDRLEVALADVEAVLARRPAEPVGVPGSAGPAGERSVQSDDLDIPDDANADDDAAPAALPAPVLAPRRARSTSAPQRPRPSALRVRSDDTTGELADRDEPREPQGSDEVREDAQLVPMQTVEAMERLSGELYLAGQRAARAEAVAELRERRLTDLQQEVEDLQREATALWEQNQELLRRVALAEAQVQARSSVPQLTEQPRWKLRR